MKSGLMALLLLWLSTGHANNDNAPLVAVASSLRHVWPHLMIKYQNPVKPRVTFGSSGNLARQITQGAPFELLLAADESFPAWLVENKTTDQPPVIYTQGRLAWVAPIGTSLAKSLLHANSTKETSVILPNDVTKIAIANPEFAPYGRAAKSVLDSINGGKSLTLVTGENAAQALQFALSGASAGGIVPLALVSETARGKLPDMVVTEVPQTLHKPMTVSYTHLTLPTTPYV